MGLFNPWNLTPSKIFKSQKIPLIVPLPHQLGIRKCSQNSCFSKVKIFGNRIKQNGLIIGFIQTICLTFPKTFHVLQGSIKVSVNFEGGQPRLFETRTLANKPQQFNRKKRPKRAKLYVRILLQVPKFTSDFQNSNLCVLMNVRTTLGVST